MIPIVYLPASAAGPLSEALWRLVRPQDAGQSSGTRYLFGQVTALDGSEWLEVLTDCTIRVHAEAELGNIAQILDPWVGHGITQEEVNELADVVISHRGKRLKPWDYFPQFFKTVAKTREEMIAAGLLADPSIPNP